MRTFGFGQGRSPSAWATIEIVGQEHVRRVNLAEDRGGDVRRPRNALSVLSTSVRAHLDGHVLGDLRTRRLQGRVDETSVRCVREVRLPAVEDLSRDLVRGSSVIKALLFHQGRHALVVDDAFRDLVGEPERERVDAAPSARPGWSSRQPGGRPTGCRYLHLRGGSFAGRRAVPSRSGSVAHLVLPLIRGV